MDIQYITVVVQEWRMGVMTERIVTYVRRIESMERFHETYVRRNKVVERLSEPEKVQS